MDMSSNDHSTDLAHLRPPANDEIDLAELIRNILGQWKIIVGITLFGAIAGVAVALLIPKQYRVEAVFSKPSTADLSTVLAQPFVELDRQSVLSDFLKNLQNQSLIEQVLRENNLLVDSEGSPLSQEQQFTEIRNLARDIRIAPAEFDFLPELEDQPNDIDQISFSLLSTEPESAQLILNSLLDLAAKKTTLDTINDINGAKRVKETELRSSLSELQNAAEAEKVASLNELKNALTVAKSLNITEPTTWEASTGDLYLKGTTVLEAEIAALVESTPKLGSIVVGYDVEGQAQIITAASIQGQLGALQNFSFNTDSIRYISEGTKAHIPADAEKPNRKLIAIAATVLAGFMGLFIALIKIAIVRK
jgi:LPS O-antigen subunit length determinant protein (WzzB/FepE family)